MSSRQFDYRQIVTGILGISFLIAFIYLARSILIPLAFSAFLAMLILPLCKLFEKKLPRLIATILTILVVIALIFTGFYFLGTRYLTMFENLKDFGTQISSLINQLAKVIEENVLHQELALHDILKKETSQLIKNSRLIEKTIFSSTTALFNIFLIVVYTFLFLLYRTSIKNFILMHFHNRNKKEARRILHNIKEVAQNYFLGLLIVMVLLGALNGLGLLWIGIDFPFLFGYTAAILAVIPYIGTFIGAVLPFLYAIMNTDNLWTPVFVIAWYTFVQAIEGNILTPNIVGSKVSMNPLVVIIALLTGNLIWGIAGMILFIPGLAILKVIFDNIAPLKPYALLLSSDFGHDSNAFIDKLGTKIKEKITKN